MKLRQKHESDAVCGDYIFSHRKKERHDMVDSTKDEGFEGGCLCGNIRYQSFSKPLITVHCYCTDCRHIGGTGHAAHTVIPDNAFSLVGRVSEYIKKADSGNLINRRFCPICASAIFHTRDGLEGMIVVRTSSLDDPEIALPDRAIYVDSALSWDYINPNIPSSPKMTVKR